MVVAAVAVGVTSFTTAVVEAAESVAVAVGVTAAITPAMEVAETIAAIVAATVRVAPPTTVVGVVEEADGPTRQALRQVFELPEAGKAMASRRHRGNGRSFEGGQGGRRKGT